jgi:MBG domain (YGX type)/Bacterial Ig-like domain (group 3)/IPT/TIG domain/Putative Ig domain
MMRFLRIERLRKISIERIASAGAGATTSDISPSSPGKIFWNGVLTRVPLCLAGIGFLALGGCKIVTDTQWVEAPIVADGATTNANTPAAAYTGNNQSGDLHISQSDVAFVKFSLATLPGAGMAYFSGTSGTVSIVTNDNYVLSADKVVHARVAFYAKEVKKAGRIRIESLFDGSAPSQVCWATDTTAPACPNSSTAGVGKDADAPTQDLFVQSPGFYTFDVTVAAQQWIGSPTVAAIPNSGLKITAYQNDDGSYGDFTFVSKETPVGQSQVRHDASLLVTLSDAVGFAVNSNNTASVQQAAATTNFSAAPNLSVNGKVGQQAYALEKFTNPLTTSGLGAGYFIVDGAFLKTALVSYVNAQPADTQTANPQAQVFRTDVFTPTAVTWNSLPTVGTTPAGTAPLRTDVANQVTILDIGKDYAQLAAANYNANNSGPLPVYYAAVTTNLNAPVTMDSAANTATGHQPRAIGATSVPSALARGNTIIDFHDDDQQWTLSANAVAAYSPAVDVLRARIGQTFAPFYMAVLHRFDSQNFVELALPVSLIAPNQGASVILPATDFDVLSIEPAYGNLVYAAQANRTVGTYTVSSSTPGHNLRTMIAFENLPLPAPSLSGPTQIWIPVGANSVTWPVSAATPFTLSVDDHIVNANIDNTTTWHFTSSVAGDTLPSDIQQTNGSKTFALTFHSAGPRTITATSAGDSMVTATLAVNVIAPPAVASVSPNVGPVSGGNTITVTGTQFTGATSVKFGNVATTSFLVAGDTQISVTAPAGVAGTVDVTVVTPSGSSAISTADNFTYLAPTISLSPATLPGGSYGAAYDQSVTATEADAPVPASAATNSAATVAAAMGVPTHSKIPACQGWGSGVPAVPFGAPESNAAPSSCGYSGSFTYAITSGTLPPGLTLSAAGVLSGSLVAAGTFSFTITATDDRGYTGSQAYSFVVTKAILTTTADDKSRVYAAADPVFTYTLAGFVKGDTVAVVSGTPILTSSDTATSAAGTSYPITLALGTLAAANYSFTPVSGTLQITGNAPQAISFGVQAGQAFVSGGTFAINPLAIASSGLAVTYSSSSPSTCTINGSTVAMQNAGVCTIAADQIGDTNYTAAAQVTQSLTIAAATSTVNLTSSAANSTLGQSILLTATVTGQRPTGNVSFNDGPTLLCSAVLLSGGGNNPSATCNSSALAVGMHTITASYESDDANNVGASASIVQMVSAATSAITLTSAPNPSTVGQAVTFTATVSTATPTNVSRVISTAVSSDLKSIASSGRGVVGIEEKMSEGAALFRPKGEASTVPTGALTFSDDNTVLGTVALDANGVATYTTTGLSAGSHTITASYSGDANDAIATISEVHQVDSPAPPTTAVSAPMLSAWMLALLGLIFAYAGTPRARERAKH